MPDTTDINTSNDGFMDGFGGSEDYEAEVDTEYEDTETEAEYDAEDTEYTAEETTESTEETTEEPEVEETIDYVYNHTKTALPKNAVSQIATALGMTAEAVVASLQKGANYEALQQRQTPYDTVINRVNRFAEGSGISRDDAIARAIDALDIIESAKYTDEIQKQYPDAPAKMVQEMALMRVRQNASMPSQKQTDEAAAAEAEREKMWVGFFQSHPEVTSDNLSARMLQALENGEDPERVYLSEQNATLQKQLKELQEAKQKAARSTGSSKKTSGNVGADPFLDSFL